MARVLLIMGNPKAQSLCDSLCEEYAKGARNAGHEVEIFKLNQFPIETPAPNDSDYVPKPWVLQQQEAIQKCDHLVFITPMWWGTMTAALKSYIDLVFASGITFKYRDDGGYDKLSIGKTSELIFTSDTPKWVYYLFMGIPLIRTFKMHILEFCGFKFKRATMFSQTIKSNNETRKKWLLKAKSLGEKI